MFVLNTGVAPLLMSVNAILNITVAPVMIGNVTELMYKILLSARTGMESALETTIVNVIANGPGMNVQSLRVLE
ncbi:MAG: hypothetical protein ACTSUE_14040 [Promethearchaeota archaeon]